MKFEMLKGANKSYIFYNDDTHEKMTADKLPELLAFLTREIAFYGRYRDELDKLRTEMNDALKRMKCPSYDEYQKAKESFFGFDTVRTYEEREKMCARLDQIYEMRQDASNKYWKYKRMLGVLTK